ncbi:MAG: biotin/lipoyl-containing protein, partial [Pseudomonadota bacterium]
HNLPFLAAVYDHPKFISGNISTAFIQEEYPDGFGGVELDTESLEHVARIAATMQTVKDDRAQHITGRLRKPVGHAGNVADKRVVSVGGGTFRYTLGSWMDRGGRGAFGEGKHTAAEWFVGECSHPVGPRGQRDIDLIWSPGEVIAEASVSGPLSRDSKRRSMTVKVEERTEGFRIRYRGADLEVTVRSPRAAELAALMPEKEVADTSKMLLCPMPGVVVSLAVVEGEAVEEGQALCTVEAMKMENVLRAERKGTVKQINAEPGASLAVDDVIMEFE